MLTGATIADLLTAKSGIEPMAARLLAEAGSVEAFDELDQTLEALIEQGWPAREAAAKARRQFGNVTAVREQSRDHWGSAFFTALGQDVRFGLRMITRAPALSAIVVLIITLGAGINSAIFAFATNLLRAPDVPHANSLVWLDDGRPLLKIVTRAATPEEFARYEHDRMPLLEAPLISAAIIPPIEEAARPFPAQGELF